jgi:hypothetical protein
VGLDYLIGSMDLRPFYPWLKQEEADIFGLLYLFNLEGV